MAFSLQGSFNFENRIQLPHNILVCGGSQTGKTTILMNLLREADKKFTPTPSKVLYLYNSYQQDYTTLKQDLTAKAIECQFVKGSVVTDSDLDSIADPNGGQTVIVIDDSSIAAASSEEIGQLFTVARHKNCSVVLLMHFIFGPWHSSRVISTNTTYYILMKSPRMRQQVSTLANQLGIKKSLMSAYDRESLKQFGYVMLDLCPTTPPPLKIRTDLHCEHQRVFISNG